MWWFWLIEQMVMKKTMTMMMTMMTIQDTWYMMKPDDYSIYGAAWSKAENLRGLHYFAGCWSVREVKFHEHGSIYDNKGWIISWSYHFILFSLDTRTWMEHFRGRGDLAVLLVILWPQLNKLGFYIHSLTTWINFWLYWYCALCFCVTLIKIQNIVKYR